MADMKPGVPWSVKGIEPEAREAAKGAARRAGLTLGQWLNQVIFDQDEEPAQGSGAAQPTRRASAPADSAADLADRLDALTDRLDQIAALPPERGEARRPAHAPERAPVRNGPRPQGFAASGERHEFIDRLDHTDASISALRDDVDEIAELVRNAEPAGKAGVAAIERALFEVVDHIELTDKRNGEVLKAIQARLSDLANRVQTSDHGDAAESREAIARLEQRLGDIARRVERSEERDDLHDHSALESKLSDLAAKVDRARHNPAVDALEARLNQITSRLSATERLMTPQTDFNKVKSELGRLRDEVTRTNGPEKSATLRAIESRITTLSGEVSHMRKSAASSEIVEKLGARLDTMVARLNNSEQALRSVDRIDAVENRLNDIAIRLEGSGDEAQPHPQISALEARIGEIASQLDQPGGNSDALPALRELEARVNEIGSRLGDAERHFSVLESIESNLSQLFSSIETSRDAAVAAAEQAAFNAVQSISARSTGSGDIDTGDALTALERGLAEVKSQTTAADRHNQETLEAIHDTLKRVIERLGDVELRVASDSDEAGAGIDIHKPQFDFNPSRESDDIGDFRLPPMPDLSLPDPLAPKRDPLEPPAVPPPPMAPESSGATAPADKPSATAEAESTDFSRAYDTPAPSHSHSDDFIAAARRAARAANEDQDNPKDPSGDEDGERTGVGGLLKRRKRTLLFVVGALFILGGVLSVSGLLGNSLDLSGPPATEISARIPDSTESEDAVPAEEETPDPATASANYFGPGTGNSAEPATRSIGSPTAVAEIDIPSGPEGERNEITIAESERRGEPTTGETVLSPRVSKSGRPAPVSVTALASPPASTGTEPSSAENTSSANTDTISNIASLAISTEPEATLLPLTPSPASGAPKTLNDAAEGGDAAAQFEVAARYADGRAGRKDLAEAASWYQRAAAQGLAPAQYRLGALYEKGQGVPQDKDAARIWYQRAAEQGNLKAMHNLAVLLAGGVSGGADYARAARWFLKAAELGLADSQYNLAVLHERGLGIERDLGAAYKWFAIASAKGDTEAEKRMNALASQLDAATLARASAAYQSWRAAPLDRAANFVDVPETFTTAALTTPSPAPVADSNIARAQELLAELGYDPGPPDGLMGPRTRDAISAFERERGLPESGAATPSVVENLEAAVAG